jgi:predicted dithiol-disulfide oxidoreductase (DUF899 family)
MPTTIPSASTTAHPPIVSHAEWLAQRTQLLEREKEATRQRDRVAAERRRLPMVRIEKDYVFEGPAGTCRLDDVFEGRAQLIVYHFMFDPAWEKAVRAAPVWSMRWGIYRCSINATRRSR